MWCSGKTLRSEGFLGRAPIPWTGLTVLGMPYSGRPQTWPNSPERHPENPAGCTRPVAGVSDVDAWTVEGSFGGQRNELVSGH